MNRPAPEPTGQRSRGQSLAEGATGIALLHIERAYAGAGTWQSEHAWVTAAAADDAGSTPVPPRSPSFCTRPALTKTPVTGLPGGA
jgi:hypothetical protein